ncbi:MAG: AAA family ATPase [Fimbriimonadaceae bacterium]
MDARKEIEILLRAAYPLLFVVSYEERRVEKFFEETCGHLSRPVHFWSLTQGLRPKLKGTDSKKTSLSAELEVLAQILEHQERAVFVLKDFHPYLRDHRVVRLLRDLTTKLRMRAQTLVFLGPILSLPTELEKDIMVLDFPLPGPAEIEETLDKAIKVHQGSEKLQLELAPETRELLIKSCQGLTLDEIESVIARSLVQAKTFDVGVVLEEKKQIIKKSELLEYYPVSDELSDVGGMELLKEWLEHRKESFSDKAADFGLPPPKGVLLLGVQGCGKSLIAKAIANHWQLPMLKLDVGRIFGSLVGQSEQNIRKAIRVAESIAPCILWADELEKGFSGMGGSGVSDSGTTARVFATFLTWMQERTKPVFLIATANDVSKLPPEMLRKGRFDEIFFIDLPDLEERESIFSIHLRKRKRDPALFDIREVSAATKGFSGAEIEQIVIGALFRAFSKGEEVTTQDLLDEATSVVPLSVMMKEDILMLREWAKLRTRPASEQRGD